MTFVHHAPEDHHLEVEAICLWVSGVGDPVVREELVYDTSERPSHPVRVQEMLSLYHGVFHPLDQVRNIGSDHSAGKLVNEALWYGGQRCLHFVSPFDASKIVNSILLIAKNGVSFSVNIPLSVVLML